MIVVIFEVVLNVGREDRYLEIAANLAAELPTIKGFISIERFRSLASPEKLLSLSYWSDEEALTEWRNMEIHRHAQLGGRDQIFLDYTVHVGTIGLAYGINNRLQAPADSREVYG